MRPHESDELSAYALGALDAEETVRVDAHLRGCPDCRQELAELRQATDVLDRLPLETFMHGPPDGDRALQGALRQLREERGER